MNPEGRIIDSIGTAALRPLHDSLPRSRSPARPSPRPLAADSNPYRPLVRFGARAPRRGVSGIAVCALALGRPAVLWNASPGEFGLELSQAEVEGLALQGDRDALRRHLAEWPSALVVDDRRAVRFPLGSLSPVPLEEIGRAEPYVVYRSLGAR